jgi:hypothetical protein
MTPDGLWQKIVDLTDETLTQMPDHIQNLVKAAREKDFVVEVLCPGGSPPEYLRGKRRFVILADDHERGDIGPLSFNLNVDTFDVEECARVHLLPKETYSSYSKELVNEIYQNAINDLETKNVAMLIETQEACVAAWRNVILSLRNNTYVSEVGRA